MAALEYLIEQPGSVFKTVKSAATNRIDEAPRQGWKTLEPIFNLKCGITKDKKLDALKQAFYLDPQPLPETIQHAAPLANLRASSHLSNHRAMAGAVANYGRLSKTSVINCLL